MIISSNENTGLNVFLLSSHLFLSPLVSPHNSPLSCPPLTTGNLMFFCTMLVYRLHCLHV